MTYMVKFNEEKQKKQLEEFRIEEAEDLAQIIAQKTGIPYLDLSVLPINTDALRLIPEEVARRCKMAAFRLTGQKLDIVTASPENKEGGEVAEELQKKGYIITLHLVSKRSLERAWERYKEISYAKESEAGVMDIAHEQIAQFTKELSSVEDVTRIIQEALQGKRKIHISRLLEIFIAGALATDSSDIHIEPGEINVALRLRLDGVLQDVFSFEHKIYKLILSRIKLLSGLKLNIKDEAQDGRYSIKLQDIEIEVRTSIIPGAYGESIVMRVLNPKTIGIPLETLGMSTRLFKVIDHEIHKPNGMLLNTGPTGSGKTTTLYAILKRVKTPKIKIITIENPIEYHLPGITQTQVEQDKGYTFLEGLRSSLRQDPDVIMVGEIRDKETAKTAINAALTGHLVLSTLHTNSAAGAIPRLIDLGINPKIIGSALNTVIAQRLIRKLCEKCKKKATPSKEEVALMKKIMDTFPKKEQLDISLVWKPQGCAQCNNTGYKGRIGIFEAVHMDETVETLTRESPGEREIKKIAATQGLLDMRQDGIVKVLQGITSLEELGRIIDLEAW